MDKQTLYRLTSDIGDGCKPIVSIHTDFDSTVTMMKNQQFAGWKVTLDFGIIEWKPIVEDML